MMVGATFEDGIVHRPGHFSSLSECTSQMALRFTSGDAAETLYWALDASVRVFPVAVQMRIETVVNHQAVP
jgi:hypothetical protein